MNKIEVVGIVAGAFSSLAPAVQMYKTFKTKKADDVSMLMFVFFLIGNILWLVYGYLINSTSIMIWNVLGFLGNLIAIYLKLRHSKNKNS
jgi:MtN3 and saliva related transmembrane protein